ncbi:MAG: hypothetical protein ACTSXX_04890 [Candidatus Baldrarchaeia archaeon]
MAEEGGMDLRVLVHEISVELCVGMEYVEMLVRGEVELAEFAREVLRRPWGPIDEEEELRIAMKFVEDVVGAILEIRGEYDEEKAARIARRLVRRCFGIRL